MEDEQALQLCIYDLAGRKVKELTRDELLSSSSSPLHFTLSSRFPIDPTRLQVSVGDTSYSWGAPELTFTDSILTFIPTSPWEIPSIDICIDSLVDSINTSAVVPICFSIPVTGIAEHNIKPEKLSLTAYPNPFNTSVRINVGVGFPNPITEHNCKLQNEKCKVQIFNLSGQRVSELTVQKGSAIWDGKDEAGKSLPSGVYFYEVRWKQEREQGEVILLK